MSLAALTAKLARGEAVILDGGMGTEIKRRGFAAGSSELSVAAMLESPEGIREIHEDFIRAGAEVTITNTYNCNAGKLTHIGWISKAKAEAEWYGSTSWPQRPPWRPGLQAPTVK